MDNIQEIRAQLYARKDELWEMAENESDPKLRLEYYKEARECIKLAGELVSETEECAREKRDIIKGALKWLADLALRVLPIAVSGYLLRKQTKDLIEFETDHTGTYSATRGLEGTVRLPSIM